MKLATLLAPKVRQTARHAALQHVLGQRPLRVCHVLYRWSRCGMELQLASQLRHVDSKRITAWVASSTPPEAPVPELPESVAVRAHHGGTDDRLFVPWLAEHLRSTNTDIVHARGLWMLLPALQAAQACGGLPVVFSFHGFDDATLRASWWRRRMWRSALGCCSPIVTVSRATRATLAARIGVPRGRIRVIHNGVDTRFFAPPTDRAAARRAIGIDDDKPLLLCVGSLLHVKGFDVLLDALRDKSLDRHAYRLILVGSDHLGGMLQRRTATNLPGADIRFVGNASDVRPYLHAADALVAPSRSEGLSNSILEAMACGLPVVATAVGGTPAIVTHGETGWLCPPIKPQALAEAILSAIEQPSERLRLGAAARKAVESRFNLERAAAAYTALYEDVSNVRRSNMLSAHVGSPEGGGR